MANCGEGRETWTQTIIISWEPARHFSSYCRINKTYGSLWVGGYKERNKKKKKTKQKLYFSSDCFSPSEANRTQQFVEATTLLCRSSSVVISWYNTCACSALCASSSSSSFLFFLVPYVRYRSDDFFDEVISLPLLQTLNNTYNNNKKKHSEIRRVNEQSTVYPISLQKTWMYNFKTCPNALGTRRNFSQA